MPFSLFKSVGPIIPTGSLQFNGSNQYLTGPYSTTNFDWYTTGIDYTIECWIYPTNYTNWYSANNGPVTVGSMAVNNGGNYWSFGIGNSSGQIQFYYYNGATNFITSTNTVPVQAWSHIAMTKTSAGITLFVNGVKQTTVAISGSPQSGTGIGLTIGAFNNSFQLGYISNLRIVKGTAVYTATFTPPTSQLTAITNTTLLLNTTNDANYLKDNSTNNITITNNNGVNSSSSSPSFTPSFASSGVGGFTLKNNSGVGRFSMSIANTTDTDAQAFFSRVTAAGGTLTINEQSAINQLVLDLKSNSLWASMIALYPMVGSSAAACAQNLISSSYAATFSGGWTYASTGVTPNGTNGYMNSSLVPSTSLTQNSAHISGYSRTDSLSGGLFGSYNTSATNGLYTNPKFTGNQQQSANNSSPGSANTSTNSNGFWINSRIVSTTFKIYRNSSIFQTSSSNSTGLTSYSIYIGGINAAGTIEYGNREVAFASIGTGLSDTDASNLYTVVQAFQTSLSRQV